MKAKKLLLITSFIAGSLLSAHAQGSFEDDIYYNPAKDTKAKVEKTAKISNRAATQSYDYTIGGHDYNGADTYTVNSDNSRDVDEYNRRTGVNNGQPVNGNKSQDDFTYTRRIEKYHNGNIISDLNDPELVEYYYATSQPEVNVYINYPGSAWYNPWYSPWAYDPWYSPWYWNNWYGPSWSWSWGWGPSWSWSWGWGPSWAWGPSWSWGWGPSWAWGPGWGGPSWGWGPGWAWTNPGSYTPNGRRPVGVRNGYTGLGSHRVNGNTGLGGNRGYGNGSVGNFRPGTTSTGNYRPGGNNVNSSRPAYTPSNNNNNGYNRTTGNRNNRNNNTYNNYNNSTNRNNGSFSNPSRGSGSTGGFGGSRGGGGGGSHRGGRR